MKIIFLDIDGVLNCAKTFERTTHGVIGVDPYRVLILHRILEATGAKIVLSSSWRHMDDDYLKRELRTIEWIDITGNCCAGIRGVEIYKWIRDNVPHETKDDLKYAILDDDSDMLLLQKDHFFHTTWQEGLTEEIAQEVIKHLNN